MMMKIIMRTEEPIFVNLGQRYNADVEGLGGLQRDPVGSQQLYQTRHQLDGWQRRSNNVFGNLFWKYILASLLELMHATISDKSPSLVQIYNKCCKKTFN